jgi:hypothetical protein
MKLWNRATLPIFNQDYEQIYNNILDNIMQNNIQLSLVAVIVPIGNVVIEHENGDRN